ncbi:hypothetical protein CEXT_390991 [Caerostris extrusa]|uniref:Uncharacterized protein n=1 Tax=Caerostris extrusa TaxID=172846 RepID=A0AAV4XLW1_CAEEX|nr:hypothetical protein CEXT_390991 [Caerostris extrusa]
MHRMHSHYPGTSEKPRLLKKKGLLKQDHIVRERHPPIAFILLMRRMHRLGHQRSLVYLRVGNASSENEAFTLIASESAKMTLFANFSSPLPLFWDFRNLLL